VLMLRKSRKWLRKRELKDYERPIFVFTEEGNSLPLAVPRILRMPLT